MDQHELATLLGAEIKRLRLRAGLTRASLAGAINIGPSNLVKFEQGYLWPTRHVITGIADRLHVSRSERDVLLATVDSLRVSVNSWQILHRKGLALRQEEIRDREGKAQIIRCLQMSLVPGLLQTPAYAACVLGKAVKGRPSELDQVVARRMDRQTILKDRRRHFHFLITESALRAQVGDPAIFRGQLNHLLEISRHANVEIGLLPLTAPVDLLFTNSFTLCDRREVRLETETAEIVISDPVSVREYGRLHKALFAQALTGERARRFLRSLISRPRKKPDC